MLIFLTVVLLKAKKIDKLDKRSNVIQWFNHDLIIFSIINIIMGIIIIIIIVIIIITFFSIYEQVKDISHT